MPTPLLIWSDAPSANSGLARICRDLATRITHNIPEFKVATVGYGAPGSSKLPFQQYSWNKQNDWMIYELPEVWEDFTEGEPGVLFCIQDAARVAWLGQPENPEWSNHPLCRWVAKMRAKKKLRLWLYPPMDAAGPHGGVSRVLRETILGFDRIIAYSKWAQGILRYSGIENTDWLPHGIDGNIWHPHDHQKSKHKVLGDKDDHYFVGIVATNQVRKDWALGIQTAAKLRDNFGKKVALWLHTDVQERFWSIPALLLDYGFVGSPQSPVMLTTGDLRDEDMAVMYSALDVFLAIGRGEGFGYCNAEALACGTPICCHAYSGYAEWVPQWMQVDPDYYHYEGLYCELRPVGVSKLWAEHISQYSREMSEIELPAQLEWLTLWPRWEEWLRRGIR